MDKYVMKDERVVECNKKDAGVGRVCWDCASVRDCDSTKNDCFTPDNPNSGVRGNK